MRKPRRKLPIYAQGRRPGVPPSSDSAMPTKRNRCALLSLEHIEKHHKSFLSSRVAAAVVVVVVIVIVVLLLHLPNTIVDIKTMGQRIVVSDVQESIHFIRYKPHENQLIIFADDTTPRFVTAMCLLDYDTVAIADKFGSIVCVRLPKGTVDEVQEDPTGVRALWDRGLLNGASQKVELMTNIFIGDAITTLQKATLIPGGNDALIYATISGTVGVLVPFNSREDFEFFQNLEMHMRVEFPPLCGRDHLAFRSYYAPVKSVIDGDLCEQYSLLGIAKQKTIAEELDRQPSEVQKKLEDIRTRYAF
uniref:Cleavage/polyadenylation specificity factor A subunit C-terminal domain-containing protein n=1 Tax=Plectus sambesii TaxID=2011161 RepID=A0A914UNU2_9BILA